jgi:hypothetical protein
MFKMDQITKRHSVLPDMHDNMERTHHIRCPDHKNFKSVQMYL